MDPYIGFEAKAVDDRHEAAHAVEWCTRYGPVGEDVPAALGQDGVERGDGVRGAGHGYGVEGLEQARGGGEEGGVQRAARGGDYLAAAAGDGVGGEGDVGEFEFGVADCCGVGVPLVRLLCVKWVGG